jgi:hypothetical protein
MRRALSLLITAIVAACVLAGAPRALADGDPASDILVAQDVFLPWDGHISTASQEALMHTVAAANKAGFEIRVAVIASPTDLGTVTEFWQKPGEYGPFLGTELSDLWGGQLLVVMPNGFGLYGPGSGSHKLTTAEAAVKAPTPGTGDHMAQAAIDAVEQLAEADGHGFDAGAGTATVTHAAAGGSDWGMWVALALGALAILAAWSASLKARPLQWRRRAQA